MSTNCQLKKASRKPFEFIQNFTEETSSIAFQRSTTITPNGLLRDYEIVSTSCVQQVDANNGQDHDGDEDDDDDEDEDFVVAYDKVLPSDNDLADEGDESPAAALPQSQSEEFIKHLRHASNGDGHQHKLSLALSSEKISLKTSPQIDKSMDPAAPSTSYTVVPISFRCHKEPPVPETEQFPSIVLKSFASTGERRATGAAATTSQRAHNNNQHQQRNSGNNSSFKRKAGGKVTFHTQAHPTRPGGEAGVIDMPDIDSGGNLPPMTDDEINEQAIASAAANEENASNSSEMVSQFGSSTSPESIMDNILSAASSVSLRSSSLSSSNTASHVEEAAKLLVSTMFGGGELGASRATSKSAYLPSTTTKGSITPLTLTPTQQQARTPTPSPPLPPPPLPPPPTALTVKASVSPPLPPPPSPPPPPPPPHPTLLGPQYSLQPPAMQGDSNRSRSPSPSPSVVIRLPAEAPVQVSVPEELKCPMCGNFFTDPRTLHCLHSFCFQCLVDENFKQDQSIPFWSQPSEVDLQAKAGSSKVSGRSVSPEMSLRSASDASTQPSRSHSPLRRRGSSFSFRRKKSQERLLTKSKASESPKSPSTQLRLASAASDERSRIITCKTCQYQTPLPIGGIRQLPQNFILVRRIEQHKVQSGEEVISNVWCSLCFEETNATYHCIACTQNLCSLCKEAHERQRSTANHKIKNIMELRRAKKQKQSMLDDNSKFTLKCGMHPGYEMKSFCTNCLEVACPDCLVLLHKGHKYETINRAIGSYGKILRESIEQTRPLCNYAEHSIERLNVIAKGIQRRCDEIQASVEAFLVQYFEALEVHRRTLLQQITRARESKVEMILEQQLDLERRNNEAVEALRFGQDLSETASDVEILSFLSILLKRFEYCQQFKAPVDPKISDSLHFLPDIRAPSNKHQNHIPLYGIITMQTVEPSLCTLQLEGSTQLRLHKRVELIMQSRDSDGVALCHGGLQIKALIKYKESNSKFLPIEVADHRDGTYVIAFTPDSQGNLILTIHINEKSIKGSPFTFQARTVRPHSGIFHCCAFCSSKGSKLAACSCNGRMPGYKGCGHGHAGHPGRRHWSCCGNVLENSECNVANKLLNPENIKV